MRLSLASSLSSLFLASSLLACASTPGEEIELPDTIVDGAADSWGHPTEYGPLFERVWQFGAVEPSTNHSFPAWSFVLDGDANVTITSRQAPTDEPDLTASVMYLYKQRDAGTWKRIARTDANGDFAALARSLGEGNYRVIVKGVDAAAEGQFLLRMECTGAGCADGEQCLVGSAFNEIRGVQYGSLIDYGSRTLTIASERSAALEAQIIAAVRESSHDDVTTVEAAFEAVDGEEINRYRMWDNLAGRSLIALEYGAGDNSYGAIFVEDGATPVAGIHDGEIAGCTVRPQACVFGQQNGDAAFMPDMTSTGSRTLTSPAGVDAMLAKQLLATLTFDEPHTLAEAIESVDDGKVYVENLRHTDGRKFVVVSYYAGDTSVGAYFRADSAVPVALNGDGELSGCTEL